ncbi:hypothetical protein IF1G_04482 [Cordyceps javanica]|uniref:Uncharacterized protein n=1 Tax=Cordyceps javanica TaxID=43265 RepID=A0A545V6A5_9HYPO|nr:hypothetical protein IF1G_04482 [Cordyceps javanica]
MTSELISIYSNVLDVLRCSSGLVRAISHATWRGGDFDFCQRLRSRIEILSGPESEMYQKLSHVMFSSQSAQSV